MADLSTMELEPFTSDEEGIADIIASIRGADPAAGLQASRLPGAEARARWTGICREVGTRAYAAHRASCESYLICAACYGAALDAVLAEQAVPA